MRLIVINWLIKVHDRFKLLPQTLFLSINLMDFFLQRVQIKRDQFQLVAVTALMIIGKYEEIYPPLLKHYTKLCDFAYTREQFIQMEFNILKVINFKLTNTTSFQFLQLIQQKLNLCQRAMFFSQYILEEAMLNPFFYLYSNLEICCGALYLVCKIFKRKNWKK